MSEITDYFLFERPSFKEGFGRAIDFWGNLNIYNYSETTEKADFIALLSDWRTIGFDIKSAISNFQAEQLIK